MATMVCRGLQSCLDSHLADQRAFIFRSPFEFPSKPPFSGADEIDIGQSPADSGGRSSLQSPAIQKEAVYVHPTAKRFNPTGLSEKSLNLCTENLGNETGSDMIENSIFSPEIDGGDLQRKGGRKSHSNFHSHSHSHSHQFPPPLTTIRETESFRVKPHREEGRLIIEAVKTPARQSCFQAERSHGRLRLCFFETEEIEEIDDDDEEEEEDDEVSAETTAYEGNGVNNGNGLVNLEQFKIATC
ncbi:protein FANTASTIC FOUR 3-like [Momordica charantia]|uniref:Protein FANTASTIC FOUR 3-like n=1 Tax=Momordica charantia TaxID=3673 RepID=A0A6J1CAR1_MOMCH|nr:protein FANTASTIC FOUR 3-like [Momordica charantia]